MNIEEQLKEFRKGHKDEQFMEVAEAEAELKIALLKAQEQERERRADKGHRI